MVFLEPETKQRPQDEEQSGDTSDANNQMSCPRVGVKRMRRMGIMPSECTEKHFKDCQPAQTKQEAIALKTAPFIAIVVTPLPGGVVGLVVWNVSGLIHFISISILASAEASIS